MPLDLLVPDLLLPGRPAPPPAPKLPALERWLARADVVRRPEASARELLANAFDLPAPPAVAAVTLAADGAAREGTWLRADPVHLRVEQDGLVLHDASVLEVTRDEAAALVEALNRHFEPDGLAFHAPAADRWYVQVPPAERPVTVALDQALGRDVFGMLPRGAGGFNWPSALTEVQMLFAEHEVNRRREAEGRPTVNSVWFWGEGERPARLAQPYALVHADEPFAAGLAKLSGTRLAPAPRSADAVDAVAQGESALVVLDALTAPLRRGDLEAWQRAASAIEEAWFIEMGRAIERFDAVRVILPSAGGTVVASLGSAARWRWWRRGKPLSSHA